MGRGNISVSLSFLFFLALSLGSAGAIDVLLDEFKESTQQVSFVTLVKFYFIRVPPRVEAFQVISVAASESGSDIVYDDGVELNAVRSLVDDHVNVFRIVVSNSPMFTSTTYTFAVRRFRATQVSAGEDFVCLLAAGRIACWGSNSSGQLGAADPSRPTLGKEASDMSSLVFIDFAASIQNQEFVEVAASTGRHVCALLFNGKVLCWGNGSNQATGSATNIGDNPGEMAALLPLAFTFSDPVVQVSAGTTASCALASTGNIYCWGTNVDGVLGRNKVDGVAQDIATVGPVLITSTASPIQIAMHGHACALYSDGKVICWGSNGSQQLGNNDGTANIGTSARDMTFAGFVSFNPALNTVPVISVSVGLYHSCALFMNGRMICWGSNQESGQFGQLGRPYPTDPFIGIGCTDCVRIDDASASYISFASNSVRIVQISCGTYHTCALFENGRIICFGTSDSGQLGADTSSDISGPLGPALPLVPYVAFQTNARVGSVSAGAAVSCVVRCDARVICFGRNADGELGLGTNVSEMGSTTGETSTVSPIGLEPKNLAYTANLESITFSSGTVHTINPCEKHYSLWWSAPRVSVVGHASVALSAVVTVNGDPPGRYIAVDLHRVTILVVESRVGFAVQRYVFALRRVPFSAVSSGDSHVCLFSSNKNNKRIVCWGKNASGQLGRDDTNSVGSAVTFPGNINFISFSASFVPAEVSARLSSHTCALLTNGGAACWGSNSRGQLGLNLATAIQVGDAFGEMNTLSPIVFGTKITDVVSQVVAAADSTCALFSRGRVLCWGDNSFGQLGQDSVTNIGDNVCTLATITFISFSDTIPAVQITGSQHMCGLFANMRVRCWGLNLHQQLGDTTSINRGASTTPESIKDASFVQFAATINTIPIDAVEAGGKHTCAKFSNGGVLCWGASSSTVNFGQLGTPFASFETIATCVGASCMAVSAAPFISFSDSTVRASHVTAGADHTCVTFVNGRILCFGSGAEGQTGIDGTANVSGSGPALNAQPYIAFSTNIIGVAMASAGSKFTCAMRCDGAVMCFGSNSDGQLGRGNPTLLSFGATAGQMSTLDPTTMINIGKESFGCPARIISLTESTGRLKGFSPFITSYLFTVEPTISEITILDASGATIVVNETPRLRTVELSPYRPTEVRLEANLSGHVTTTYVFNIIRRRAVTIAAYTSTCLLTEAKVACWGANSSGQLARGDNVSFGKDFTDMTVLEFISFSPSMNAAGVESIAMGSSHVCAVFHPGSLLCWGDNGSGQAGLVDTGVNYGDLAGEVEVLAPITFHAEAATALVVQVSAGQDFTCVLFSHGRITCFGGNDDGQSGANRVVGTGTPATASFIDFSDTLPALQISSKLKHTCAVFLNRRVRCWGANSAEQLGDGTRVNKGYVRSGLSTRSAEYVAFATSMNTFSVVSVAVGAIHSCALFAHGRVMCWGCADASRCFGQAGCPASHSAIASCDGAASCLPLTSAAFVVFSDMTLAAVQIDAGFYSSCVLFEKGRTLCFGSNSEGQLGTSTAGDVNNGQVSLASFISFSDNADRVSETIQGYLHTCVVKCSGSVMCFGMNQNGELGHGTSAPSYGLGANDITTLGPIAFDPAKIPNSSPLCAARILSLVDSAGALTSQFAARVTTYVVGVRGIVESLAFTSVVTEPAMASVSANGVSIRDSVPLFLYGVSQIDLVVVAQNMSPTKYTIFVRRWRSGHVSLGSTFTCLLATKKVACWGNGASGRLAQGGTSNIGMALSDMSNLSPIVFAATMNTLDVVDIDTGYAHACALFQTGAMICWGLNDNGALGANLPAGTILGDGVGEMAGVSPILFAPTIATIPVVQISAGEYITCALFSVGRIICWGRGYSGALGQDQPTDVGELTSLQSLSFISFSDTIAATQVALNTEHVCALFSNGRVRCWGVNDQEQLGDTTTVSRGMGKGISSIKNVEYISFVAHLANIPVIGVTVGSFHSCALFAHLRAICWGALGNSFGQLGTPFVTVPAVASCAATSCLPLSSASAINLPMGQNVVQIAAGDVHTCVIAMNGDAICFGVGAFGRLGSGSTANLSGPAGSTLLLSPFISFFNSASVGTVSAGESHTCVIRCGGSVFCFGLNSSGELGYGDTSSRGGALSDMSNLYNVAFDSAKIATTAPGCVSIILTLLESTGKLISVFNPRITAYGIAVPHAVSIFAVTEVTATPLNAVVLVNGASGLAPVALTPGRVNTVTITVTSASASPVQYVIYIKRFASAAVALGDVNTCVLSQGRVACFGDNLFGQLGREDFFPVGASPGDMGNLAFITFSVTGLVSEIAVGYSHVCAIFTDSLGPESVLCWGSNLAGELGSTVPTGTHRGGNPSDMANLQRAALPLGTISPISISAGKSSSCVTLVSGGVICWGLNDKGQLGQDHRADVGGAGSVSLLSPIRFSDTYFVLQLSTSYKHTCALFANARVRCWGKNDSEELGDGTTKCKGCGLGIRSVTAATYVTFAASIDTVPIVHVAAGGSHSCAVFSSGGVVCWGASGNPTGQVGTVFAVANSVSSCGSAVCQPVSLAGYISFSSPTETAAEVAAGDLHTCVLFRSQRTICFGEGQDGATGANTSLDISGSPGPLLSTMPLIQFSTAGLAIAAVSAGSSHTCALRCDGLLMCFGKNGSSGRLGYGSPTPSFGGGAGDMLNVHPVAFDPVKIPPMFRGCSARITTIVETTGGLVGFSPLVTLYLFAVSASAPDFRINTHSTFPSIGAAVSVNDRDYNTIVSLPPRTITKILVQVTAVGYSPVTYTLLVRRFTVSVVAGGSSSTCFLTGLKLTCWGGNLLGQLGKGDTAPVGFAANQMSNLSFISFSPSLEAIGVSEISAGGDRVCALFLPNSVLCFGDNTDGLLGSELPNGGAQGDASGEMTSLVPILFKPSIATCAVLQIASGLSTNCVLFTSGRVVCWGKNANGEAGRNTIALVAGPGVLATLDYISFSTTLLAIQVSVGYAHVCILSIARTALCWGKNSAQQLGDGTGASRGTSSGIQSITTASFVSFAPSIAAIELESIATGLHHTCGLFVNGKILCWGGLGQPSGALGMDTSITEAVASCGTASCLPVSAAGFVAFSNDSVPVKQLSVGEAHTCVLFVNGGSICFGEGSDGKLGTDSDDSVGLAFFTVSEQPYITFSDNSVSSLVANPFSTCAIKCNGQVLCFGSNSNGELGRGSIFPYGNLPAHMISLQPIEFDPVKIPTASTLECSARLVTLVESSGQLTGFSRLVTFYLMTVSASTVFLEVTSATAFPPAAVITVNESPLVGTQVPLSEHWMNSVRVTVTASGYQTILYHIIVRRLKVATVSASSGTTCLASSGKVTCWGDNSFGQLGRDSTANIGSNPTDMSSLNFISFAPALDAAGVSDVSVGSQFSCALFNSQKIACWGFNVFGQLGADRSDFSVGDATVKISTLAFISFRPSINTWPIIMVSAGTSACALFANGGVVCWGVGMHGQLGNDQTVDIGGSPGSMATLNFLQFSDTTPAGFISAGENFSCALFLSARVRCWGQNSAQQLGDGTEISRGNSPGARSISSVPFISFAPSINMLPIRAITAGAVHACALFYTGRVVCWGGRTTTQSGYLGTVHAVAQSVATCGSASCLPLTSAGFISFSDNAVPVVRVDAGDTSTCALFDNGKVLCFGTGADGRLGNSNALDSISGPSGTPLSSSPYISFSDNAILLAHVAVGSNYACVVRCDGRVLCFGNNSAGRLGSGSATAAKGAAAGDMSLLQPIDFDPAKIPPIAGCTVLPSPSSTPVPSSPSSTPSPSSAPSASPSVSPSASTAPSPPTTTSLPPPPAAPGIVAPPTVAGATSTSLVVFWPPASANGSPVLNYTLERNGTFVVTVTTCCKYTDVGLSPDTLYAYNLTATNAIGMSPPGAIGFGKTALPLTVTSIRPRFASALGGTLVTIVGTGFTAAIGITLAGIGIVPSSILTIATTEIIVLSPSVTGSSSVSGSSLVTLGTDTAVSPEIFTILVAPTVTAIVPSEGPPGTKVTLSGTNFEPGTVTSVLVASLSCTNIAVKTSTSLTCETSLSGTGSGPAVVEVAIAGASVPSAPKFTFVLSALSPNRPVITSLSPSAGTLVGGTTVTISGTKLGVSPGDLLLVRIGVDRCASVRHVSETQILCVTDASAVLGSVPVVVTTALGGASVGGPQFTYTYPPPIIHAANPRVVQAPGGGTEITLRGAYFGISSGSSVVASIAGTPCVKTTWVNSTVVTCVAPPRAQSAADERVLISVLVDGQKSLDTDVGFRLAFRYATAVCTPVCGWNEECSPSGVCSECAPGFAGPGCMSPLIRVTPPESLETSEDGLTTEAFFAATARLPRDIDLIVTSSNPLEGTAVSVLTMKASSGTAPQKLELKGVADAIRDGAVGWTATVSFDPSDPDYGRAAPLAVFDLVNLDSRPKVSSLLPRAVPMLGANATLTGLNWDYVISLVVGDIVVPPENITRLTYMDGTTPAPRGGARSALQVSGSGVDTITFVAPESEVQGYVPVTVVNNYGGQETTDTQMLFYTDDCPKEGQYGKGLQCKECPEGAECPGGYRLWPKAGYWAPREDAGYVVRCTPPEACLGTRENLCAEGYEGPECSQCSEGYVKNLSFCEKCPSSGGRLALIIGDIVVWLLIMSGLWFLRVREYIINVLTFARCLQQLSSIGASADESFNPLVRRVFDIFTLFSGDVSFVKADCHGKVSYSKNFYLQLGYSAAMGIVLFGGLAIVRFVNLISSRTKGDEHVEERRKFYSRRFCLALMVYLASIYYVLTKRAVAALMCVKRGEVQVLLGAPYVTCFKGEHVPVLAISIAIILSLTVGFPVFCTLNYLRNDKKIADDDDDFAERWDFFIQPMKKEKRYRLAFWVTEVIFNVVLVVCDSVLIGNAVVKVAITVPYMSMLILAAVALRPFGTFMEGMINCTIWVTGILASVSNLLHSEGKLVGAGNKACTYTIAALTFVVMFAIVLHVMLGIFSKERQEARKKRIKAPAIVNPDLILNEVIRQHAPEETLEPVAPPVAAPPPPIIEDETFVSNLRKYFSDLFGSQPLHEQEERQKQDMRGSQVQAQQPLQQQNQQRPELLPVPVHPSASSGALSSLAVPTARYGSGLSPSASTGTFATADERLSDLENSLEPKFK